MILLESILHDAIKPMYALLPASMGSAEASVMLLTIGLQESRFMYTFQTVAHQPYRKGPARGYWQFEVRGTRDVMYHPQAEGLSKWICRRLNVDWLAPTIWELFETNNVLAAAFARLLLWTDAKPLPSLDSASDAWDYYTRTWQPGSPRRDTWNDFHQQALDQIVNHTSSRTI